MAILLVAASAAASLQGARPPRRGRASGEIKGAGSTFVAPLIAAWQQTYKQKKGVKVTYNPIGSGGGITAITNKTVDFGASDAPMTPDQFSACGGCVQTPVGALGDSVMYNLPGVKNNLHMTGPILADIYLGKITKWNDARDQRRQPGRQPAGHDDHAGLPQRRSGTTYNFTTYLNTVSPQWKSQVGRGTTVNWPAGVGARGSSGVSASSPARRARSATPTSRTR